MTNLLFTINICPMLYFLIKKQNELQIQPVHSEGELLFRALYGHQILIEGISIQDVLSQFNALPVVISEEF